ncbi:MAG: hypothetical protein AAFN40_05120 [Cyanobacteria bacterium J06560_6]
MYKQISATDISKLHNEVNLYINQRLIITTTAITVFGVVAGLIAPVTSTTGDTEVRSLSLILPAVLMVIFGVMLWYCQSILQQIHALSTYLVETKASAWEDHYQRFDDDISLRSSVSNLPLYVFAALGFFSVLLSIAMYVIALEHYSSEEKMGVFYISIAAFVAASAFYWFIFINFWNKKDPKKFRKRARKHWRKVLDEQAEEDFTSMRVLARLSEASFAAVWENTEDDVYNEP